MCVVRLMKKLVPLIFKFYALPMHNDIYYEPHIVHRRVSHTLHMPTIVYHNQCSKSSKKIPTVPTHDSRVAKFENTKVCFGYSNLITLAKFKVVWPSILVLCHPPSKPMTWRPTCDLLTRHMANPMKFSSQPSSFPCLLNVNLAREDSFRTTRFDAF
jgi:hypothetical protein